MGLAEKHTRDTGPEYLGTAEEVAFLRSMPWLLDATEQNPDLLIKTLHGERHRFKGFARQPTFSLLAVLKDSAPEHLDELILSARAQSYPWWQLLLVDDVSHSRGHLELAENWARRDNRIELVRPERPIGPSRSKNLAVERSNGDFLVPVDGDGALHPMALGIIARHLVQDPRLTFVFTNEAEVDPLSRNLSNFLSKPPLDLFTLLRIPYVGRLFAIDRGLLIAAAQGGDVFLPDYDGIEEHELLWRVANSRSLHSLHVPLFAYYRRALEREPDHAATELMDDLRRRMIEEHLPSIIPSASWTAKPAPRNDKLGVASLWITDLPDRHAARLLVVVPFKDQVELTLRCLESIESQEHRLDVLVVLVNNRSSSAETMSRLRDWRTQPRAARYEFLDDDGAFNFGRLNNAAIGGFGRDRDLILFLNNDVELLTPEALQVMAMQLLADPQAGFVGIKLLYPGGEEVQHGGVRIFEDTYGAGYYRFAHVHQAGEFVDAERVSLCVTFACAMTRRETFEELGGMEETFFPNSLGDVDLCLRAVGAGYRNYYLGSLTGTHHESISRGHVNEDVEYSALHERHGHTIAFWRQRYLRRSSDAPWALLAVSRSRMPLRYRVADLAVGWLKSVTGPVYGSIRKGAAATARRVKEWRNPTAHWNSIRIILKRMPFLGPAAGWSLRTTRRLAAAARSGAGLAGQIMSHPSGRLRLTAALRSGGFLGLLQELNALVPTLQLEPSIGSILYKRSRPSRPRLEALRSRSWDAGSPRLTVVMPVYNVREPWLKEAIGSVLAQTYAHWELICVNDASPSPHIRTVLDEMAQRDCRVRVFHSPTNQGVSAATNLGIREARGDYVCFMDHDDYLEPHALHCFAEAIIEEGPDMLYSDEAVTGENLDAIRRVDLRPAFSYDHYLGHPYFVHLIAARTSLVREVGGLDEGMTISQDVDLNLRLIETCGSICHVPEILYRWRTHPGSLGHKQMERCRGMTRGALERHFARTGQSVTFEDKTHFNYRDIRFDHGPRFRVAILIACCAGSPGLNDTLAGIERTVDPSMADVVVVGRRPDDSSPAEDLASAPARHRVLAHRGEWNLSAIINHSVAAVRGPYTHYLVLGCGIEPLEAGWLEHMLRYVQRGDIGCVGGLLLSDPRRVGGAGLIIRRDGLASNAARGAPFRHWIAGRNPGENGCLLASRDVSAVSAACLLTRADVFHLLDGFDERLTVTQGDADYCLRASASGFRTILDAYAVLLDRRGRVERSDADESHSEELALFRVRHRVFLEKGDPFHHPMLERGGPRGEERGIAGRFPKPRFRTMQVAHPSPAAPEVVKRLRADAAGTIGHGPFRSAQEDRSGTPGSAMPRLS
jgi:GT2 family glycosyltransferase